MTDIISQMRTNGFDVTSLVCDGKIQRFGAGKKSNYYIGFQNHSRAGEIFYVVLYGSWKTGENFVAKSGIKLGQDDQRFVNEKVREAKKKFEIEKAEQQERVAAECELFWKDLKSEPCEYLEKKGISHDGTKSAEANVIVPCRDIDGKLWGLQKIQPDGGKFFWPGQRVSGNFHLLGTIGDTLYLAEGFATAWSIRSAIKEPVAVAFNAGNLVSVAEAFRKKYPKIKIVICADNDEAGLKFAEKAAQKATASIIFPDEPGTDFNDLRDPELIRAKILAVKKKSSFLIPLGFREKEYFFTSTSNQQIVGVNSFSHGELLNLMPLEYWEIAFPGQKGVNWTEAESELRKSCRARGIFAQQKVRGSGVWLDAGRLIVNQGDHLLVDGSRVEITDLESKFFYTLGLPLPELSKDPLENCDLICQIAENFRWQKKEFGPLVAGALVISKICGALPIRPHIWITGASQTGKSTLLEKVVFPCLHNYSQYLLGGTTEAGLRQALVHDSRPVIFDEFETNGPGSSEKIQACIELMRTAWSESHGSIAKGSSSGNATFYQPRFSAIVSSIRVNLPNDADRSRFTQIELAPHGNDPVHWAHLSKLISQLDQTYIDRLFARSLALVRPILASYDVLRRELAGQVGARFGQQYGMLLAGYWSLKSESAITPTEAKGLLAAMDFGEERDEAGSTDEVDLLAALSTMKLRAGTDEHSVLHLLNEARKPMSNPKTLEMHGIRIADDFVCFASNHFALRAMLKETKWANCYSKTLARVTGSEKNKPVRFYGKVLKATKIPVSYFFTETTESQ